MQWIYEHTEDNSARFVLGTAGENPLICFGINPSTAEPDNLDPTLKRVSKYAEASGFDSWIMLNLYPQRTTDPGGIHTSMDKGLNEQNLLHIDNILKRGKLQLWAAWGENIDRRDFLPVCLESIYKISKRCGCRWFSLGNNAKMHPFHPLYRGKGFRLYSTPLKEFDMAGYIETVLMKSGVLLY